jgi:hypothetical protein
MVKKSAIERLRSTLATARKKTEETVGTVIQAAEVGAGAFGWSYANARYSDTGEIRVFGVPADLAVGLGLHVVALFDGAGRYGEHFSNLGDGSLASYLGRLGAHMGSKALQTAGAAPGQRAAFAPSGFAPQWADWQQQQWHVQAA